MQMNDIGAQFRGLQNLVDDFIGLEWYMGGHASGWDHAGRCEIEDKVFIHISPHQVEVGLKKAFLTCVAGNVQTKGEDQRQSPSRSEVQNAKQLP